MSSSGQLHRRGFCLVALVGALNRHLVSARLSWLQSERLGQKLGGEAPGLPCQNPVKRAPVVFPDDLVLGGTPKDTRMFSGYVNVTDRDYLFYWFAEAKSGAPPDAPLIVWSNGGPGCSAMEGMTTEHGPLVLYGVKEDSNLFAGKLSRNPYSWNNQAHVLYVDQPRYVGYSCGTGPFAMTSLEAGNDLVTFLRGWRLLFPEHSQRNLILAAESYGGHYVPAWSTAILNYNEGASDPFVVVGLAIGNGIVNDTIQSVTFPEFASRQRLIPKNASLRSSWGARELMKSYLGYVPNYYDYRLTEQDCCGCSSYNYKLWSDWMLREDVNKALNVCGDSGRKAFGDCAAGCIDLPSFDKEDTFSYSDALSRALQHGIRVTLYYGMQDTACNYVGGYAMASSLQWSGMQEFGLTPLEDLMIGGVSTGNMKSAGGLTWIQVEDAGHMVPINNPAAASFAIGTLIHGSWPETIISSQEMDMLDRSSVSSKFHQDSGSRTTDLRRAQELVLAFASGCLCIVGLAIFRTCPKGSGRPPRIANSRTRPRILSEDGYRIALSDVDDSVRAERCLNPSSVATSFE